MSTPTLQIVHQGRVVEFNHVPAEKTLIELIRENMHIPSVKEGCAGGDCGACAVVLGRLDGQGIQFHAVNSCIRLAHSVHGMALWTAQDLAGHNNEPHPVAQALRNAHASQCGFCTPGFAMSLLDLYQNKVVRGMAITRQDVDHQLSGNLCRCTGYRPIAQAALSLEHQTLHDIPETPLRELLMRIAPRTSSDVKTYELPTTLEQLLQLRHAHPQAQLVAGCTDVGLWVNKQHQKFSQVIDLTQVAALKRIDHDANETRIGAAVTLEDAFASMRKTRPSIKAFCDRFAGLLVRQSGTLGGNIANGSPIGDSMPLLIALRSRIVLSRWHEGRVVTRSLLLEDFYKGYRVKDLAPSELLTHIVVPNPTPQEWVCAYKISKRQEDDISAIAFALKLQLDTKGQLIDISIGLGGVAATPVRARQTEKTLLEQGWNAQGIERAKDTLAQEFSPISDLRATAQYRQQMMCNLLQRAWLESQHTSNCTLEQLA